MADLADVETALVGVVSAALYPNGAAMPGVVGAVCKAYRGWPNPQALDADLASGAVNVTVFPVGRSRTTTRYPETWQTLTSGSATLTASVDGQTATFGGVAASLQVAGLAVDGRSYVYAVQAGDTPDLVAASLAALARTDFIVLTDGASLTVPGARVVLARVVTNSVAVREVRRQTQDVRVSCWCADPATRDAVAGAIDAALAATPFMDLPDGLQARVTIADEAVTDKAEEATLYRRDLIYAVDYATTETATQPAMLFGTGEVNSVSNYLS